METKDKVNIILAFSMLIIGIGGYSLAIQEFEALKVQVNIQNEQLREQIKSNSPILAFSAPCNPITKSGLQTIINSYLILQNLGNSPLPFNFNIKSKTLEFMVINSTDACSKFSNDCNYTLGSEFAPVIEPKGSQKIEYLIKVQPVEMNPSYTITVKDLSINSVQTIASCNYTYVKEVADGIFVFSTFEF